MQPHDFHDLLARARSGDRAALDELLAAIQPWLEQTARAHADPDQPDASVSDLVQQAWLKAWQKLDQFQDGGDNEQTLAMFRAWLSQIVHQLGLNARRDRQAGHRRPPGKIVPLGAPASDSPGGIDPPADQASPSADLAAEEQARLVREALARIADGTDREIVRLRFFEGLSLRQIAGRLGMNHETLRQRYHAVMRRLERELGGLA